MDDEDISIHAPLAGCDVILLSSVHFRPISIHAPLAGCDTPPCRATPCRADFNPRTPCGVRRNSLYRQIGARYFNPRTPCGVRPSVFSACTAKYGFQSTHPLRGATRINESTDCVRNFNPRTPCGVRHYRRGRYTGRWHFNPRTPCGVRPSAWKTSTRASNFNPRTPCGVRRSMVSVLSSTTDNFNPRTPCGVRLPQTILRRSRPEFQSTHPLRGATWAELQEPAAHSYFNPRTPCGVRRYPDGFDPERSIFQSTHPLRGATRITDTAQRGSAFQSTHPLRGATQPGWQDQEAGWISIHAPLAGCDSKNVQRKLHFF